MKIDFKLIPAPEMKKVWFIMTTYELFVKHIRENLNFAYRSKLMLCLEKYLLFIFIFVFWICIMI